MSEDVMSIEPSIWLKSEYVGSDDEVDLEGLLGFAILNTLKIDRANSGSEGARLQKCGEGNPRLKCLNR